MDNPQEDSESESESDVESKKLTNFENIEKENL